MLRVGKEIGVKAYIDVSYGIHSGSGRSHTGCAIVVGEADTVDAKSAKQANTTKFSAEAELVALSLTRQAAPYTCATSSSSKDMKWAQL